MESHIILGTYKPRSNWAPVDETAQRIGRHLVLMTKRLGINPTKGVPFDASPTKWFSNRDHAEVRYEMSPRNDSTTQWHQDHNGNDSMDFWMVTWADKSTTQLLVGETIYTPEPFEIVLFSNLKVKHRKQSGIAGPRWFFRQRVDNPDSLRKN